MASGILSLFGDGSGAPVTVAQKASRRRPFLATAPYTPLQAAVDQAGHPVPLTAPGGLYGATVEPWVGGAKDIYNNVLTPIGHAVGSAAEYIARNPNADPNAQVQSGNAASDFGGESAAAVASNPQVPATPPPPNPLQAAIDAAGHGDYVAPKNTKQKDGDALPPSPDAAATAADQPAVTPETTVEPPGLDATGLPGTSTETATGALDFTTYMKKIKEAYPDLDFSNPKQAEADANARRDLDRTAMLAQLSLAAGMVKGAGVQWQGIGQGFENAGTTYDKGYQKYQQALQDSADRYGKQMESQMTYDTARRQQALSMYTSAQTQAHEDARTLFTEKNKRQWEIYQEKSKSQTEAMKMSHEDINKFFDKFGEQYKPPSDPSMMDPDMLAKNERINRQIMAAREASIRLGKIYLPTQLMNVADQ